ncbi:MAG: DNA translocase FtsK [Chloroflexi bacterium]|nr:DNA translocase FtsK [Chloroflexota bacterium]
MPGRATDQRRGAYPVAYVPRNGGNRTARRRKRPGTANLREWLAIGLVLVGLASLVVLVVAGQMFGRVVGIGAYGLPPILIGEGLGVVLRISWRRLGGWALLFAAFVGAVEWAAVEGPIGFGGGAVGSWAWGLLGSKGLLATMVLMAMAGISLTLGRRTLSLLRGTLIVLRRARPILMRLLRSMTHLVRQGAWLTFLGLQWSWRKMRLLRQRQQPSPPSIETSGVELPSEPRRLPTLRLPFFRSAPEPSSEEAAPSGPQRGRWRLPPLSLLERTEAPLLSEGELRRKGEIIEQTLADFGVPVRVVEIQAGPVVTQFGVEPGFRERKGVNGVLLRREKVKVSEVTSLSNDLTLALAAPAIRIEAPVPGRSVIGIEVPNSSAALVSLRSQLETQQFQRLRGKLRLALGQDVSGQPVVADLAKMPHLLIAGATGSGKSVCINSVLATLLMQASPDELRLLLIDPKRVERSLFQQVPHLLGPIVSDLDRVVPALEQAMREMDRRYREFALRRVRNIEGYNRLMTEQRAPLLPYIVLVIDELADLMMLAPEEAERSICRLAQLARATGIHLIVATQRPSVDVVTGLIKANFPARLSFMVTSLVDSRTILDMAGAERLLGRGDMLYLPSDAAKPIRTQGTFVSDDEITALVEYWSNQRSVEYVPEFAELPVWSPGGEERGDELYEQALELAGQLQSLSISLLQRRLRIGFNRAARLMELLQEREIVGPADSRGSRPVIRSS